MLGAGSRNALTASDFGISSPSSAASASRLSDALSPQTSKVGTLSSAKGAQKGKRVLAEHDSDDAPLFPSSSLTGGSASSASLLSTKLGKNGKVAAPKGQAKAKAAGTKRTFSEGPGSAAGSGSSMTSAAKVDSQALLDEGEKWVADIKTVTDLSTLSVEAAANLAKRLQDKSRALGKRVESEYAIDMLHRINVSKKAVSGIVNVLKAVPVMQKSRKRANCTKVLDAFNALPHDGVEYQHLPSCLIALRVESEVWVNLGDSPASFLNAAELVNPEKWPQGLFAALGREAAQQVQIKQADSILCEFARVKAENKKIEPGALFKEAHQQINAQNMTVFLYCSIHIHMYIYI